MRSYIAITVHFISDEKLHNVMLACRQSKGHHTAENIATRSLKKWPELLTLLAKDFSAL